MDFNKILEEGKRLKDALDDEMAKLNPHQKQLIQESIKAMSKANTREDLEKIQNDQMQILKEKEGLNAE